MKQEEIIYQLFFKTIIYWMISLYWKCYDAINNWGENEDIAKEAQKMLGAVKIFDRSHHFPSELSG